MYPKYMFSDKVYIKIHTLFTRNTHFLAPKVAPFGVDPELIWDPSRAPYLGISPLRAIECSKGVLGTRTGFHPERVTPGTQY